jgi:hypothetical protein
MHFFILTILYILQGLIKSHQYFWLIVLTAAAITNFYWVKLRHQNLLAL